MAAIITLISVVAVMVGIGIYAVIDMTSFNRKMVKYAIFQAELEAKENEWERQRSG